MLSVATICLAMNIYHEARGEPLQGQYAVAHVTMNRVKSNEFPNDVCGVVVQKRAFAWVPDNRVFRKLIETNGAKLRDQKSWLRAKSIAQVVMRGRSLDLTNGAVFFNAKSMGRRFQTESQAVAIGDHIFY
ncbi:MAG: cell wall hydrolase [Methylomicrobium sp.]|nr:cell wall hydrolase [Methylomicrobium sp.]